jgi:hypothetical protein
MARRTPTLCLVVAVGLSLAGASPAGARVPTVKPLTIVPGVSIGGVTVGMSKAKAVAAWGKPDACSADQYKTTTCEYRPNGPVAKDFSPANYQVAEFKLRSGKVVTVSVMTTPNKAVAKKLKRLKTSKNIRLGSKLPDARRAYGLPAGSGGEAGITRALVKQRKRCTLFYAPAATVAAPGAPIEQIEVGLCTTNNGLDGGL